MNILLVEDDTAIGRVLVRGLAGEGYGVNWQKSGVRVRETLASRAFGAAILDLGLPDIDGITLCETLRRTGIDTPVLMLTARDTLQDKLDGFGAGADDYLPKPFAFSELLARLNAIVRRREREQNEVVVLGNLRLDAVGRLMSVGGVPVQASKREFDLLLCLARAAGNAITRDHILNRVWGDKSDVTHNTVDVYVGYVRQLLVPFDDAPRISTVRGIGYRLEIDPARGGPKYEAF